MDAIDELFVVTVPLRVVMELANEELSVVTREPSVSILPAKEELVVVNVL